MTNLNPKFEVGDLIVKLEGDARIRRVERVNELNQYKMYNAPVIEGKETDEGKDYYWTQSHLENSYKLIGKKCLKFRIGDVLYSDQYTKEGQQRVKVLDICGERYETSDQLGYFWQRETVEDGYVLDHRKALFAVENEEETEMDVLEGLEIGAYIKIIKEGTHEFNEGQIVQINSFTGNKDGQIIYAIPLKEVEEFAGMGFLKREEFEPTNLGDAVETIRKRYQKVQKEIKEHKESITNLNAEALEIKSQWLDILEK